MYLFHNKLSCIITVVEINSWHFYVHNVLRLKCKIHYPGLGTEVENYYQKVNHFWAPKLSYGQSEIPLSYFLGWMFFFFFFQTLNNLKKNQVTVSCVPFKGLDLKMKRNIRLSNMSGLGLWYQGDRQGLWAFCCLKYLMLS